MLYEQKIKYMEYRESGTKVKGAGFVKLERWGEAWNVLLQISGLPAGCTGEKGVYLCGGRKEVLVGLISMDQGRGRLELQEDDTRDPSEDGIRLAEAERIRIPIGPEKEVVGILKEIPASGGVKSLEKAMENRENLTESRENLTESRENLTESRENLMESRENLTEGRESLTENWENLMESRENLTESRENLTENRENLTESRESLTESRESLLESKEKLSAGEVERKALAEENPGDSPGAEDREGPSETRREPVREELRETPDAKIQEGYVEAPGREKQDKEDQNREIRSVKPESSLQATSQEKAADMENSQPYVFQAALQPDKWDQLRSIYPSVRPFGDDREYLRISPGDFVILKDRSYRLANNSFLLHGYFNYKHLILHRSARQGETLYFVGVPGNFYDKEKEVAILFGFESFECAREPAKEGDYGYYMMRVEL